MTTITMRAITGVRCAYEPAIPVDIGTSTIAVTKFRFSVEFHPKLFSVSASDIASKNIVIGYQILSSGGKIVQSANFIKATGTNTGTIVFIDNMAYRQTYSTGVPTPEIDLASSGPYKIVFTTLLDTGVATYNSANVINATDGTPLVYTSYTIPYRSDPKNNYYTTDFPLGVQFYQENSLSLIPIILYNRPGNIDNLSNPFKTYTCRFSGPILAGQDSSVDVNLTFNVGKDTGKTFGNGLPKFDKVLTPLRTSIGNFILGKTSINQVTIDRYKYKDINNDLYRRVSANWLPLEVNATSNYSNLDAYTWSSPTSENPVFPANGFTIPPNWAGNLDFTLVAGGFGAAFCRGEKINTNTSIQVFAGDRIVVVSNFSQYDGGISARANVSVNIDYGPNNPNYVYGGPTIVFTAHGGSRTADGSTPIGQQDPNITYSPSGVNRNNTTGYAGPPGFESQTGFGGSSGMYIVKGSNNGYIHTGYYYITLIPDTTLTFNTFSSTNATWSIAGDNSILPSTLTTTPPAIPSGFRIFSSILPNVGNGTHFILDFSFTLHNSQTGCSFFYNLNAPSAGAYYMATPGYKPEFIPSSVIDDVRVPLDRITFPAAPAIKTGTAVPNLNTQNGGLYTSPVVMNNTITSSGRGDYDVIVANDASTGEALVGIPISFVLTGSAGAPYEYNVLYDGENRLRVTFLPGESGETLESFPNSGYTVNSGDVINIKVGQTTTDSFITVRRNNNIIYNFVAHYGQCALCSSNASCENPGVADDGVAVYDGTINSYTRDDNKLPNITYTNGTVISTPSNRFGWGTTTRGRLNWNRYCPAPNASRRVYAAYFPAGLNSGIQFDKRGGVQLSLYYNLANSKVPDVGQTSYTSYDTKLGAKSFVIPNALADGATKPSSLRYTLTGGGGCGSVVVWNGTVKSKSGVGTIDTGGYYARAYGGVGGGSGQQVYGVVPIAPGDIVTLIDGEPGSYTTNIKRYFKVSGNFVSGFNTSPNWWLTLVGGKCEPGDVVEFPNVGYSFICDATTTVFPFADVSNVWSRGNLITKGGSFTFNLDENPVYFNPNVGPTTTPYNNSANSRTWTWSGLFHKFGGNSILRVESPSKNTLMYAIAYGGGTYNPSLGGKNLFDSYINKNDPTPSGPITPRNLVSIKDLPANSVKDGLDTDTDVGAPSVFTFSAITNGIDSGKGGNPQNLANIRQLVYPESIGPSGGTPIPVFPASSLADYPIYNVEGKVQVEYGGAKIISYTIVGFSVAKTPPAGKGYCYALIS